MFANVVLFDIVLLIILLLMILSLQSYGLFLRKCKKNAVIFRGFVEICTKIDGNHRKMLKIPCFRYESVSGVIIRKILPAIETRRIFFCIVGCSFGRAGVT